MDHSRARTAAQALPAEVPVIPPPLVNRAAVEAAIRLIVPDGVTELRALDATTFGDRWPGTVSGYFDDPRKLAEAATAITAARGVYFIPNCVDPRLLARAANRLRRISLLPTTLERPRLLP